MDEQPVCLMRSRDPAKAEAELGERFQAEIEAILEVVLSGTRERVPFRLRRRGVSGGSRWHA